MSIEHREYIYHMPETVAFDKSLSSTDLRIYMIIRSFMDARKPMYASNNWIAEKLGVERRTIITCINRLVSKGYIEKISRNNQRFMLIKQSPCIDDLVISRSLGSDLQITPPSDLEITHNIDNINISKNNKIYCPPDKQRPLYQEISIVDSANTTTELQKPSQSKSKTKDYLDDERFIRFYKNYPRKQKPQDAYKAFLQLNPSDELLDRIVNDVLDRTYRHTQWQDKQYIPLPASYLRSKEYDGEIFNVEEENKKKAIQSELEAKKREAAQERISRDRLDSRQKEREYQIEKDRRAIDEQINWKKITEDKRAGVNAGLKALKKIVGLSCR